MENPAFAENNPAPSTQSTFDEFPVTAPLTDVELREACQAYIKEFCCYGSKFLLEMNIIEIQNVWSFHYQLESLGEKRESKQKTVIYQGEYVDRRGEAPDPWEVYVATSDGTFEFKEHQMSTVIPHTTYITNCTKCLGKTTKTCGSCYGDGESDCCYCNGRGSTRDETDPCATRTLCIWCLGTGTKSCWTCSGRGVVKCKSCKIGKMKNYRELTITWKPHADNFISNTQNLPKEMILEVGGRELFSESGNSVQPINLSYDRSVIEASLHFVSKHSMSFTDERIIAQRHFLRAVPYTKATYTWKNKKGEFYVYGLEKKVYFEDYPQTCCMCTCC